MPIRRLSSDTEIDDIHVVLGHATFEHWNHYAPVVDATGTTMWVQEYQAHHADVSFRFLPRFRGPVTGHVHQGFGKNGGKGIRVNMVTGQVLNLPPAREFCAVCRYILVDAIDPALHDLVDRAYDSRYPQA